MSWFIARAFAVEEWAARMAICHGRVMVGSRSIGLRDMHMTREQLKGQVVLYAGAGVKINDNGRGYRKSGAAQGRLL